MTDVIKYLIVGSGSDMKAWWEKNKQKIITEKYRIIPMNNAWSLVGASNIYRWYVPSDFYARGSIHPTETEINSMREISLATAEANMKATLIRRDSKAEPTYYKSKGTCPVRFKYKNRRKGQSGTMFINTSFSLMADIYDNRRNSEVYLIGTDFDYTNNESHFYSDMKYNKAANDPMRYGKEWLEKELDNLNNYAIKYGYSIYNISHNINTLLPFQVKSI